MRANDLHRILQGIELVTKHTVHANRPIIVSRVARAQFHAKELLKVFIEFRGGDSGYATESTKTPGTNINDVDPFGFPAAASDPVGDIFANIENNGIDRNSMKEREIPSSQFARMVGFGSLGVRMALGFASEGAARIVTGTPGDKKMSQANAERLADTLTKMRGAALKLGQILNMNDGVLPTALSEALKRVHQTADYMPRAQLEQQIARQLGDDWRSKLSEFDDKPIAAASIGQVHRAKLLDGTPIAMKIQFPGVADSIDSDLGNLKRLVQVANILPPGLFMDQIIRVASNELAMECDYVLEAESQRKYRAHVLSDATLSKHVSVPEVVDSLSTSRVLTSHLVAGVAIDKAAEASQEVRNAIARTMLQLTVKELFQWRLMQSDPNFGNFLFDSSSNVINLVDFGATRAYSKTFVDGYMRLVWAAANKDEEVLYRQSVLLGFLTGEEHSNMKHAHIQAGMVVGEPFLSYDEYDFAASNLTARISTHGDVFMKFRLTPPPTEVYSLHRKLAGAFMLCIKLRAKISCRAILEDAFHAYKFSESASVVDN